MFKSRGKFSCFCGIVGNKEYSAVIEFPDKS